MSLTPMGDVMVAVKADIDDYQKAMATASDSTGMLTSSLRGVARMARSAGAAMTVAGGLMAAGITGAVSKANKFAQSMREINTLTSTGTSAMEQFGGMTRQLAAEMGNAGGVLEMNEALYQSLSAGMEQTKQAQEELLRNSAMLADVAGTEVSTALDVTTSTLNAYNMEAEQSLDVMNSLFGTVEEGKVRMDELASTWPRVAAMASNVRADMDEALGGIAELTAQGFEPRIAGTSMRAMVRSLLKPSEAFREVLLQMADDHDVLSNEMGEAADIIANQREEIEANKQQMEEWQAQIDEIKAQNKDLSNSVRKERLKIMEIRQEAMEQGRELTEREERQIEGHQAKIKELRMEQTKNKIEQHDLNKSKREAEERNESLNKSLEETKEKYGVNEAELGKLLVKQIGLVDTFREAKETGEEMGYSLSQILPETRALNGAMGLLNDGGQKWAEASANIAQKGQHTREELEKLVEQGKMTREEMEQRLGIKDMWEQDFAEAPSKKIQQFKNQLGNAIIEIGLLFQEMFGGFMDTLTETIRGFRNWLNALPEDTKEAIAKFTALATALLLVLGPLLMIGGQLAIMVGTLGTTLIPLLGALAVVLGISADKFRALASGGEEAEQAVSDIQRKFGALLDFLRYLKDVFMEELLDPIIAFAKGVVAAGKALVEGFTQGLGMAEEGEGIIRQFASAIGAVIERIGVWLKENKHIFKQIGRLVGALIRILGPALWNLATAIWEVIKGAIDMVKWFSEIIGASDESESSMKAFVDGIIWGAKKLATFIDFLAKAIRFLQPLLSALLLVATGLIILGKAVALVSGLMPNWVGLVARYIWASLKAHGVTSTFAGVLRTLLSVGKKWFAAAKTGTGIIALLTRGMTFLSRVVFGLGRAILWLGGRMVAALGKAWQFIKGLASTRKFMLLLYAPIQLIITALSFLARAFWNAVDRIIGAAKHLYKVLVGSSIIPELMSRMYEIIIGGLADIGRKAWEKGKNIAEQIAAGLKYGAGKVKEAVFGVADTVMSYLPSSDAEVGPMSGLSSSGEAMPETFAEGIKANSDTAAVAAGMMGTKAQTRMTESFSVRETSKGVSIGKRDKAQEAIDNSDRKLQKAAAEQQIGGLSAGSSSIFPNSGGGMPGGDGKKIEINEKAIYFEQGAFEGVAEEEMPDVVRDEIESSLDEILEDIDATGQNSRHRYTR